MKTKLQIKDIFGKVLFEYECEDNTIKKTLEEAVRQGTILTYADLNGADLIEANLERAYLHHAVLINAKLDKAFLKDAFLKDAVLKQAKLNYTFLKGADLKYADLTEVYLKYADLTEANLSNTILKFANLEGAKLTNADLRYAYLDTVTLENANLEGADLRDAILTRILVYLNNVTDIPFIPLNLPEGEFIAYKKVRINTEYYIVKLKVLADSKRSRAGGDKCRCDKALVLEIQDLDGNKLDLTEITNYNYAQCTYKVGEIVYADSWDENRFNECSHGIHFFLDRQRAVNYVL